MSWSSAQIMLQAVVVSQIETEIRSEGGEKQHTSIFDDIFKETVQSL